jgi:hypothetical protein
MVLEDMPTSTGLGWINNSFIIYPDMEPIPLHGIPYYAYKPCLYYKLYTY